MKQFFVAYDPDLEIYTHGTGPVGTWVKGLVCTIQRWPLLGIKVLNRYDPESSPPRLIQRIVEFD